MPLILKEKDPKYGKVHLWSINEDAQFFRRSLAKTGVELNHITDWHPKRQLEWMSGRYLIQRFSDLPLADLAIDKNGKPNFPDSGVYISISHTDGLVGLQVHTIPVGMDLQIESEKIHRVSHKFCTESDYEKLGKVFEKKDLERITWSLKESTFKAYGKGKLSYQDHILLKNVHESKHGRRFEINIEKGDLIIEYVGRIRIIGPYCFSQVYEKSVLNF